MAEQPVTVELTPPAQNSAYAQTCTAPRDARHFSRCDCLDCFADTVTEMENERD